MSKSGKSIWQKIKRSFIKGKEESNLISKQDYYRKFGIEEEFGKYSVKDKERLEKAYSKAWETRNFEINKLWSRSTYFWGFIFLSFGGYLTLLKEEIDTDKKGVTKHDSVLFSDILHLKLYILLAGILFSFSWLFIIIGSRRWQRNWEAHIDQLEDFVSGPLYKTINYDGRFYSMSKLNQSAAYIIIAVWLFLLTQFLNENYTPSLDFRNVDYFASIAIAATFIFGIALRFGFTTSLYIKFKETNISEKTDFFDRTL